MANVQALITDIFRMLGLRKLDWSWFWNGFCVSKVGVVQLVWKLLSIAQCISIAFCRFFIWGNTLSSFVQKKSQKLFLKRLTYLNVEIRGDLIAILKVTHGLLEFPMSSNFAHPTHKEIGWHAYKTHKRWFCTRRRQFAFTIRAVPFCNEQQAEIVNAPSVNLSRHAGSPNSPKRQIPQN